MRRIIGRFYFKEESSQNLSGHFSNNLHTTNFVETANRIFGAGFLGTYESNWTDDTGSFQARLSITQKENSIDIFSLHWVGNGFEFWGEGFVIEHILIGDYRNFSVI